MKKIASLLMALLLAAATFTACNNNGNETSNGDNSVASQPSSVSTAGESAVTSTEPDEPYTNGNGIYVTDFDKTKYEGKTINIIVRGEASTIYQSDDFIVGNTEYYGDNLINAVEKKNEVVEEEYGVTLNIIKDDNINSSVLLDLNSGTQLYEIIMPVLPQLANWAREGLLCDLTELENMHLDAPWYSQYANNAYSVANRLYFTTGDITILNKVNTISLLFNIDYATQLQLPNLYDLVKSGEWTYDKMMEFAKLATADTDGESGMTGEDNWGVLTAYADALSFYGCFGYNICSKDSDDLPYLTITDSDATTTLQNILTDMASKGTWCCYAQDFEQPIWVTSLEAFKQGRVLFRPSAFSATTKLRIAGTNFGILPMPKKDTNQDQYYAYCGTGETVGFAIPYNCSDPEFSAYMVEAISCESKNYLTPAYMEVNLKSKDAKNDEDLEMLEIIFNNIKYDIGEVYDFGKIKSVLYGMVQSGDSNIVSKLDSLKDSINSEIETLIDQYESRG